MQREELLSIVKYMIQNITPPPAIPWKYNYPEQLIDKLDNLDAAYTNIQQKLQNVASRLDTLSEKQLSDLKTVLELYALSLLSSPFLIPFPAPPPLPEDLTEDEMNYLRNQFPDFDFSEYNTETSKTIAK